MESIICQMSQGKCFMMPIKFNKERFDKRT